MVNAYTLTFAGFLLLGGRAADLLGRRKLLVVGLAVFAATSLLGGLAQTKGMLIAARGLQGLGGAIVAPATLSVLTSTFAVGRERNRALGLWGAMGGAGGASGALLGGILTQTLSWRWILFINIPIGVVAALAAHHYILESRADTRARRNFDLAGAITVTAGLVVLVYGIVTTDTYKWASAHTVITLGIGVALLALFVLIEARLATAPLVPLRVFKSRELSAANVVVFTLGASAFAMWYFLSLYLQEVRGFSPIQTGLAFFPMALGVVVGAQLAGARHHALRGRAAAGARHGDDLRGNVPVRPGAGERHLLGRRLSRLAAPGPRHRPRVRAGHDRRHGGQRAAGVGACVRAREHLETGWRLARAGGAGHGRDGAHREPDRPRQPQRRRSRAGSITRSCWAARLPRVGAVTSAVFLPHVRPPARVVAAVEATRVEA